MAKTSDVDILIVPGWSGSGADHWQTRWERKLPNARRVQQADWFDPRRDAWTEAIIEAVSTATRPVVLVAHSLGVIAVVHALTDMTPGPVAGAFLVAPADVDNAGDWPATQGQRFPLLDAGFVPIPTAPLACPTVLVGSRTDPYCRFERALGFSYDWGSAFIDGGDSGHINVDSGHGPWPEGLLQFGALLRRIGG